MGLLQGFEQVEHLGLHGDVKRGGWLVGDQQFGFVGQGHGDHGALALPAGKLVRIIVDAAQRIGDADSVEQLQCAGPGGIAAQALMHAKDFPNLLADGVDRIERTHRLLKNHAHLIAAHRAQGCRIGADKLGAVELNLPGHRSCRRLQAEQGKSGYRLS